MNEHLKGTPRPAEPPFQWQGSGMTMSDFIDATQRWVRWHEQNPHLFKKCECCDKCIDCPKFEFHPIHGTGLQRRES